MMSDTIITKQGKDTLAGLPAHQLLSTSTGTEHREDASIYNSKQQYCLSGYIGAESAEYDKIFKT